MMRIFDQLDRALRHLREGRRTRQYQIAEEAGITKAMLSAYETGKQKPSLETLDKLLGALGCDLIDLHQALAVCQDSAPRDSPRSETGSPVRWRQAPPALLGARAPEGADAAADVYSALGIDQPLERDEEEALAEVLSSFHKLIRHIHGRLHESGPDAVRSETGEASRDAGARRQVRAPRPHH